MSNNSISGLGIPYLLLYAYKRTIWFIGNEWWESEGRSNINNYRYLHGSLEPPEKNLTYIVTVTCSAYESSNLPERHLVQKYRIMARIYLKKYIFLLPRQLFLLELVSVWYSHERSVIVIDFAMLSLKTCRRLFHRKITGMLRISFRIQTSEMW